MDWQVADAQGSIWKIVSVSGNSVRLPCCCTSALICCEWSVCVRRCLSPSAVIVTQLVTLSSERLPGRHSTGHTLNCGLRSPHREHTLAHPATRRMNRRAHWLSFGSRHLSGLGLVLIAPIDLSSCRISSSVRPARWYRMVAKVRS